MANPTPTIALTNATAYRDTRRVWWVVDDVTSASSPCRRATGEEAYRFEAARKRDLSRKITDAANAQGCDGKHAVYWETERVRDFVGASSVAQWCDDELRDGWVTWWRSRYPDCGLTRPEELPAPYAVINGRFAA